MVTEHSLTFLDRNKYSLECSFMLCFMQFALYRQLYANRLHVHTDFCCVVKWDFGLCWPLFSLKTSFSGDRFSPPPYFSALENNFIVPVSECILPSLSSLPLPSFPHTIHFSIFKMWNCTTYLSFLALSLALNIGPTFVTRSQCELQLLYLLNGPTGSSCMWPTSQWSWLIRKSCLRAYKCLVGAFVITC